MSIHLRRANTGEYNTALEMLHDAAAWLKSIHIDYWQVWLDPPENYVDWIRQGFDNGEFYFAQAEDGEVVGMLRLQYADEMFWGNREDKAGYIHSFTTSRKYKGRGIGCTILTQIEAKLAGEGVEYLRLDCAPHVEKLCAYYESYGFEAKETVTVYGEELRLYEKNIVEKRGDLKRE